MTARRRAVALLLAGAVVAAACGSEEDPLALGFKRVSLDLVFKDATKASPAEAQRIIQVIELFDEEVRNEPEVLEEEPPPAARRRRTTAPPGIPEKVCLPADPNQTPETPVFGAVRNPPVEGSYDRRNVGQIKIVSESPLVPSFTLPYPEKTTWSITDIERTRGTVATNPREDAVLGTETLPKAPVAPDVVRFTMTRTVSSSLSITETYQYYGDRAPADADTTASTDMDGDGLFLVRRETKSDTFGTSVFTPTPPVMVVPIGDETETTEANVGSGIDRETGSAMTIESKILSREPIDVCGEMVDTYRVQWEEQFVDNSQGRPVVSGNVESGKPNIWNVSFSDRLMIVREEKHTQTRTYVGDGPAAQPVTLSFDYVSTLGDLETKPLRTGSAVPRGTTPAPDEEDPEE